MYCVCVNVSYCHWVSTQLQLNISYHIKTLCGTPRYIFKNRTVLGKTGRMGTLLVCHMFGVLPSGICKCITPSSQFKPE